MARLLFAVYDGNDLPGGSPLGTLTDARDKVVLIEDNGVGSGSFTINARSDQWPLCVRGNYVAAFRDTVGDLEDALGAFWIEGGTDTLVSPTGRGGQDSTRTGRGSMAYLAEPLVWHRAKSGNRRAVQPSRRRWHWDHAHPGRAYVRMLEEARARGTIPGVTWDFTRRRDSDGDLWDEDEAQKLNIPIGLNLLELVDVLRDSGLHTRMTPDLVVRAWDAYSRDLTGSVGFTAGADIRDAAIRQLASQRARSRVLVEGENKKGRARFRAFTDGDVREALGRHKEGYVRYERTATRRVLRRVARRRVRKWKNEYDEPLAIGVREVTGQVAMVDYVPGDTIALNVDDVIVAQPIRIASITLADQDDGAGQYHPIVELGSFLSGRLGRDLRD